MRTVAYQDLERGVCEQLGWPVRSQDGADGPDAPEFHQLKRALSKALEVIWRDWWWPDLTVTEQRQFAADYAAAATYVAGDQVFHVGSQLYYVALRAVPINEAPATLTGTSTWTANDDYWAELKRFYAADDYDDTAVYAVADQVRWAEDGRAYQLHTLAAAGTDPDDAAAWGLVPDFVPAVPLVQAGHLALGDIAGVAATNPKAFRGSLAVPWALAEDGLLVFPLAGAEVVRPWVTYLQRPHRFTGDVWDATATYEPAEDDEVTGGTITVPSSDTLNGFASRTAAKASLLLVNGRYYYVGSGDAGFLSGWFLYDVDSTATADDSDTLLAALGGRLLRQV